MKYQSILVATGAVLCALAACVMPPSMYERASYPPPAEGNDRSRGAYDEADPRYSPHSLDRTDPMREGGEIRADETRPALRDPGVVASPPQGRVVTEEGTPRGLETPPAGRMHIIELYQQVLDERDALSAEVERLREELDATRLALDGKTAANEDLSTRLASVQAAHQALMADNQSIAARLVQAQIRRLEAEKMLLETRIESERSKNEIPRAGAAPAKGAASPTKAPAAKATKGHGEEHE
jgi:hypothetical protein